MFYNAKYTRSAYEPVKYASYDDDSDSMVTDNDSMTSTSHADSGNFMDVNNTNKQQLQWKLDNGAIAIDDKDSMLTEITTLIRTPLIDKFTYENYNLMNDQSNDKSSLCAYVECLIEQQKNQLDKLQRQKCDYESLSSDSDIDSNGVGFTDHIILRWMLMPFVLIFSVTMFHRFKYLTFALSILWLSILSYMTVWSISGLSEILAIPPTISGMTILSAGSAGKNTNHSSLKPVTITDVSLVPDLVTSIIVIKKTGTASMGICAAIASNIFAILLGLGLPWGIQFVRNWVNSGSYAMAGVPLESGALTYTLLVLLAAIMVLYITFRMCQWKVSKKFALICVLVHILFVCSGVSLELFVNKVH